MTSSKNSKEECRFFDNPFPSFAQYRDNTGESYSSITNSNQIMNYIFSRLQSMITNFPTDNATSKYSGSVYVGIGGFCVLFLRIIQIIEEYKSNSNKNYENFISNLCLMCNNDENCTSIVSNDNEVKEQLLKYVFYYNAHAMKSFDRSSIRYSFLEGIPSAYAIRIVFYFYQKNQQKMDKYLDKLRSLATNVLKLDSNELLYGKCGYLSAFLYIHQFTKDDELLLCNEVKSVAQSVINDGKQYAEILAQQTKHAPPLMWTWHDTQYYGGAHGVAGILLTLMYIPSILQSSENKALIIQMLDFCQTLKLQSGNYASSSRSLKKGKDILVQFCHGCPSFVHMYSKAYEVFGNELYLQYAAQACDVVWKRGLLKKGPGLCHGIGGSGYSFLCMYRYTKNAKSDDWQQYMYRALQFANFMTDPQLVYARKPDRPFSMFEGIVGGISFAIDCLMAPDTAKFPCFEY